MRKNIKLKMIGVLVLAILSIGFSQAQQPLPAAEDLDEALAGTHWRVTGYSGSGSGLEGVLSGTELSLHFGTDGSLGGSAGCNRFGALYAISGSAITIGLPMSTRKFCMDPAGVMGQETAFLTALPKAVRFERTGERLNLRAVDDALLATLERSRE